MSCEPRRVDLTIVQGSTFKKVLRYVQDLLTFKAITAIAAIAPARITVVGHGIPDNNWPFRITGVKGMVEINSDRDNPTSGYAAIVVDSDTIDVKNLDASEFTPYSSGGYIQYNTPVDLDAFDGTPQMRMHIRESVDDAAILLELTTDNGRILVDNGTKKITLQIDADDTGLIEWDQAVYDLEGVSSTGEVTPIAYGRITVNKEITR